MDLWATLRHDKDLLMSSFDSAVNFKKLLQYVGNLHSYLVPWHVHEEKVVAFLRAFWTHSVRVPIWSVNWQVSA